MIEPEDQSIFVWSIFEVQWDIVDMDNWMKVPAKLLIEQGFIEEVKEHSRPRWKVGDKAIRTYLGYSDDYIQIYRVTLHSSEKYWIYNDDVKEDQLRDPTPEELSLYFR